MIELSSFDELTGYVRSVLAQKGDLDESTPMIDRSLRRGKEQVGVEFTMLAPRSVRLSAIWAADENRILFYDADGARFQVVATKGWKA